VLAFAFPDLPDDAAVAGLEQIVTFAERPDFERARLLGYYTRIESPSEDQIDLKLLHLKRLISANPAEPFLSMPLDPSNLKHRAIAEEWRAQCQLLANSPAVLSNAATFLVHWDWREALLLIDRGIRLEPAGWRWRKQRGDILLHAARKAVEREREVLAADALTSLQEGLLLAAESERRFIYSPLSEAALLSRNVKSAEEYAHLSVVAAEHADWIQGTLRHTAHMVLGALAFDNGDTLGALRHLEESLLVPASPQFQVRGPLAVLLRKLSAAGRCEIVAAYVGRWQARFDLPQGWSLEDSM
jgi:hypothetical protein